ncbi:ImmA/IrrE family metallo-endopeptidase [Halomonas borealis]|uniref:ImmA/IrrE family metallo-endopeptidase n=1 Tax=Halomonas borealis TaxID=2508710 RepID=UPI001444A1CF|nr:ImmA/IrrE family metallo-endopeptidase [Halomonas borealis]
MEIQKFISANRAAAIRTPNELLKMAYGLQIEEIEPPIDVENISKKIENVKLSKNINSFERLSRSGEIKVQRDTGEQFIEIWINPTHHTNRQRFTIAHELGHLFNDILPHINDINYKDEFTDNDEIMFKRAGEQKLEEYLANSFAADLLMPKEIISRKVNEIIQVAEEQKQKLFLNEVIQTLCEMFQTSYQAMEIRLKNLGYID